MLKNTLILKVVPLIGAILVFAVTMRLGFWQLDRAQQREALEAQLLAMKEIAPIVLGSDPVIADKLQFHPVQARGEWQADRLVLLDNQIQNGRVGFHVFMPLKLGDSNRHVLVNRGWIAGTSDRQQLPRITTPPGSQWVSGYARLAPPTFSSIAGTSRVNGIWSDVSLNGFAEWSGLLLQPLILYQTNDGNDGLIRDWAKPGNGAERNRGYAIQWFAMAAMVTLAAIYWVVLFIRQRASVRKNSDD